MFTTICELSKSGAAQERVSQLRRALKKINPEWTDHYLIPIPAVGLENVVADVQWVLDRTSVHVSTVIDDAVQSLLAQSRFKDGYLSSMALSKSATVKEVLAIYNAAAAQAGLSEDLLMDPIVAVGEARRHRLERANKNVSFVKAGAETASIPSISSDAPSIPASNADKAETATDLPIQVDEDFFIEALSMMPKANLFAVLTAVNKNLEDENAERTGKEVIIRI